MPLQYPTGTLAEHRACRTDAVGVRRQPPRHGPGRRAPARSTGCRPRSPTTWPRSAPGRAQYTHLLDADDASVLDDIIVWWVDDERFDVMPNASNTGRVRRRHRRRRRDRRAGPSSPCRARRPGRGWPACRRRPPRCPAGRWPRSSVLGTPCVVAGTGYTGEDGVELAVPADAAAAGVGRGAGAGRRRPPASAPATRCASRRACPLHGHELGPGITPLQAGLGWVVAWDKGDFRGRAPLAGRARARAWPAACGASRSRVAARPGPTARC